MHRSVLIPFIFPSIKHNTAIRSNCKPTAQSHYLNCRYFYNNNWKESRGCVNGKAIYKKKKYIPAANNENKNIEAFVRYPTFFKIITAPTTKSGIFLHAKRLPT